MRKKCIWNWNWHARKEIEYWDEWGKWHDFYIASSFVMGIILTIGIPAINLIIFWGSMYEESFQYAIMVMLLLLTGQLYMGISFYEGTYGTMLGGGVYYLNENGIQMEYYPHIYREIRWEDIDIIERRTFSTGSREEAIYGVREIFFICKKGCTEKEKKPKPRSGLFYANHRKKIVYIGYSKEREAEFRKYWSKEIRDQRKWTKGLTLF